MNSGPKTDPAAYNALVKEGRLTDTWTAAGLGAPPLSCCHLAPEDLISDPNATYTEDLDRVFTRGAFKVKNATRSATLCRVRRRNRSFGPRTTRAWSSRSQPARKDATRQSALARDTGGPAHAGGPPASLPSPPPLAARDGRRQSSHMPPATGTWTRRGPSCTAMAWRSASASSARS